MTPEEPHLPLLERVAPRIKDNLPPLMGCRNARFIRIGELLAGRYSRLSMADRRQRCHALEELIALTESDTRRLQQMLNSPDTRRREAWLLTFLSLLRRTNRSLLEITEWNAELDRALDSGLFTPEETGMEPATSKSPDRLANGIASRLNKLFRNGNPTVHAYFCYVVNSFSKEHLDRYNRSFAATMAQDGTTGTQRVRR